MKESEFLDELATFPEWGVFGRVISNELERMIDEEEISGDDEEWCSPEVLEKAVWNVSGEIEDEIMSFIAKLARIKYQDELGKLYAKEYQEHIKKLGIIQ